jgi:hypothetical protein
VLVFSFKFSDQFPIINPTSYLDYLPTSDSSLIQNFTIDVQIKSNQIQIRCTDQSFISAIDNK